MIGRNFTGLGIVVRLNGAMSRNSSHRGLYVHVRREGDGPSASGGVAAGALTAAKGAPVILVLNQYKCIGCSPGKRPDTGRMVFASRTGSRDIAHDRYLGIDV